MTARDQVISATDQEIVRRLADLGDPEFEALVYEAGRRRLREALFNLVSILDSSDPDLQQQALEAIGDIGDRQAGPHVLALLDREQQPTSIRNTGAWVLGLLRFEAGTERLMRMLRDGETTVRSCAAAALVAIGDPIAAPEIRIALALENDAAVRDDLERALASLAPRADILARAIITSRAPSKARPNDAGNFAFYEQPLPRTGTLG